MKNSQALWGAFSCSTSYNSPFLKDIFNHILEYWNYFTFKVFKASNRQPFICIKTNCISFLLNFLKQILFVQPKIYNLQPKPLDQFLVKQTTFRIYIRSCRCIFILCFRSRLRKAGGKSFGNSVYNIDFEHEYPDGVTPPLFGAKYNFHLEGVVDCPEFLVHFPTLRE